MGQPFVGEIRIFAGMFAPVGWAFCDGSQVPIDQNPALFQLIGTTYGGDGQNNFQLPDLRGRAAMHIGQGAGLPFVQIGQSGGVEGVTLTTQQIPSHPHGLSGDAGGGTNLPGNAIPAVAGGGPGGLSTYTPPGGATTTLSPKMVQNAGGNQPHENRQPFLTISFIISLFGIFPSQS